MSKKKKKDIEDQINEALNFWGCQQQIAFLKDIVPLFELYDLNNEADWVKNEDQRNVCLIRMIYLISRIAEFHSGKLANFSYQFPNLHKKMREKVEQTEIPV